MSEEPSRRNALGWMGAGGTLLGGGLAIDAAVDADRRRRGLKGPVRSLREGRLPRRVLAGAAAKTASTGVKSAGVPLVAYGAYKTIRGERAPQPSIGRDVIGRGVRGATFADAAKKVESVDKAGPVDKAALLEGLPEPGRMLTEEERFLVLDRLGAFRKDKPKPKPLSLRDLDDLDDDAAQPAGEVGKRDLTQAEQRRLSGHKQAGRYLSLAGGTLGVSALALRAPEAARAASRFQRLRRMPALRRVAAKEPAATKASNTLGVAAIGTGAVGSFNYAAQQKLEREAVVPTRKSLRSHADEESWRWRRTPEAAAVRQARRDLRNADWSKDIAYGAVGAAATPIALTGLRAAQSRLAGRFPQLSYVPDLPIKRPEIGARARVLTPALSAADVMLASGRVGGKAARALRIATHPASVGLAGVAATVPVALHLRRDADRYRREYDAKRKAYLDVRKARARVKIGDLPLDQVGQFELGRRRKRKEKVVKARVVADASLLDAGQQAWDYLVNHYAGSKSEYPPLRKAPVLKLRNQLRSYSAPPQARVQARVQAALREGALEMERSNKRVVDYAYLKGRRGMLLGAPLLAASLSAPVLLDHGLREADRRRTARVTKSLGDAMVRGVGRVRVLHSPRKGFFMVVDGRDQQRLVHGSRLTWVKQAQVSTPAAQQLRLPFEKAFSLSSGLRLRRPAIRSSYIGTSRYGKKFTVRGSVGVA